MAATMDLRNKSKMADVYSRTIHVTENITQSTAMNAKVRLRRCASFAAQISVLECVFEMRAITTLGDRLMNGFHWFSGRWVVYGL